MNFTITVDTGNIEKDIISTIKKYNAHEMKVFLNAIKLKKEEEKIYGQPIFFRYPDCEKTLASITDVSKVSLETRKFVKKRTKRIDTEILFINLSNPQNKETEFIKELINLISDKIDIRRKFYEALANEKYNEKFYDLCFKIISLDEYYDKFLKYEENKELFGHNYTQEDYVLALSNILGYQHKDINKANPVYKYPIVTFNMFLKYLNLRKIINVDIKMLGEEVFKQEDKSVYSKEYQEYIDSDWNINPTLEAYIFKDINPQYNIMEKICHIYLKLCQALRYNLGYHIKRWRAEYNKERQESITPENNKIICSEFSMILTNIINKLDDSVEARCIVTGKEQHLSVGIIIRDKNIRIDLDSTKVIDNFDDLARIKLGMPLVGINYLCDRNSEFKKAFDKVYDDMYGKTQIKTEDLIEAYETLTPKQEIIIDFYENIAEFTKRMKKKNVVGSELLSVFKMLYSKGYFGKITYSIIGEDKKLTFIERAKLETAKEVLDGLEENIIIKNKDEYYLLRLDECELIQMTKEELNELFENDKMRYFNPKHKIEGVGVKPCKKN